MDDKEKEHYDELYAIAAELQREIPIKDRVQRLRTYENCFVGSEAVTWLVKRGWVESRRDAVALGNELLGYDFFRCVTTDDLAFVDDKIFYRFQSEIDDGRDHGPVQGAKIDFAAVNEKIVTTYVEQSGALEVFRAVLRDLYSLPELPDNPFPGLIAAVRSMEEKHVLWKDTNEKIRGLTSNALAVEDADSQTTHVQTNFDAWGSSHLLGVVDAEQLSGIKGSFGAAVEAFRVEDKTSAATVLSALVGGYIFFSTLEPDPVTPITIRQEFLAEGKQVESALNLFAKHVFSDLSALVSENRGIFLSCVVPTQFRGEEIEKVWKWDQMQAQKKAYIGEIKAAVATGRLVYADIIFIFRGTTERSQAISYFKGRKEYVFHFKDTATGQNQHFGPVPFQTLYEGIFFDKHDCDVYVAACANAPSAEGTTARSQQSTRRAAASRVSRALDPDRTGAFRETLAMRIANACATGDDYVACHHVLVWALLGDEKDQRVVPNLYRMFHSTAGVLHGLIQQSAVILGAVTVYQAHPEVYETARAQFVRYKEKVIRLFDTNISSDLWQLRRTVRVELDQLSDPTGKLLITDQTIPALERVNYFCRAAMLTIASDVLRSCSDIQKIIAKCQAFAKERKNQTIFASVDDKDKEKDKDKDKDKAGAAGAAAPEVPLPPGSKPPIVVDVERERNVKNRTVPVAIAREGVLLQYSVDTGLDDALKDIWSTLLSDDKLVPNPYPFMAHRLKKAKLRFDLWKQSDADLTASLMRPTRLADRGAFVYTTREEKDVFGPYSAVAFVEAEALMGVLGDLRDAANNKIIWRLGAHKLTISTGISGELLFYGSLLPVGRIPDIRIVEDYAIDGPQFNVALELFLRNIYQYLMHIFDSTPHLVVCFVVGPRRWSPAELKRDRREFLIDLGNAVNAIAPLTLEMYFRVGNAYIPVSKQFRFHYTNPQTAEVQLFSAVSPTDRYFTIYLSQEKAAAAYALARFSGDPRRDFAECHAFLWQFATERLAAGDILSAHKALLMDAMGREDDAIIAEISRMLSSPAQVLSSLRSLGRVLIDILMKFEELEAQLAYEVITTMLEEYSKSVSEFLLSEDCIIFQGTRTYSGDLLKRLIESGKDPLRRTDTVRLVEETNTYLDCIGNAIAALIHEMCPKIATMLAAPPVVD